MDCVIGFTGKNFTLIGADQNAGRSIMVFQQDLDKIMHLDSHKLLGVAGDPADTVFEPQYLQKNVELYRLRNGVKLSTHATANYIRGEKAANLRKAMTQVDMLVGGYDEEAGPSLCAAHRTSPESPASPSSPEAGARLPPHPTPPEPPTHSPSPRPPRAPSLLTVCVPARSYFIDYLASMQKIDKGGHGYGGMFCNSLLDAHWKADLTETEAVALMDMCIKELHTRFMISMPNWLIKVRAARP